MKTVVQELIDIMNNDQVSFTEWFQDNYKIYLEKEKEQIAKSVQYGYSEWIDASDVNDYYNKIYKQD